MTNVMKNIALILMVLGQMCHVINLYSQVDNNQLNANDVINMSLEELLHVKVNVSTTKPTDIFNTPSAVTVIDRELIDQYNFTSVAEALRQVGGVEILQTVIDKNVPTIRGILQNFYANKVLIMINNIPVWNPTYGNSSLDRININDIERIEVLKGPASVLYGTNAYNGVVNLILRSTDKSNLHAQLSGGMPAYGGAAINFGEQKGDFSWYVTGSSSLDIRKPYLFKGFNDPDTNIHVGDNHLFDGDTMYYYGEELRNQTININMAYKSHQIFINSFKNSYTNPGVVASYKTGANRTINDKGALVSYAFDHNISQKTHLRLNTYYDYHYRNQIMSQANSMAARFSSYRMAFTAKLNHDFNNNISGEIGSEMFKGVNIAHEIVATAPDTVLNVNIKSDKGIIEGSAFAQLNIKFGEFNILGGVRLTQNNNFGTDLSPRVTAVYKINNNNSVKLMYGQSFRTPNMIELYFDHKTVAGNPDLEPEKCQSAEIKYMTRINQFFAQVTAYHSIYSNLISRVLPTQNIGSDYIYSNTDDFEGFGVEAEFRYQAPKQVNLFVNCNYSTGNEKGIYENFKYTPEYTVSWGVNKSIKNFFVSTNSYMYSSTQGHVEPIPEQLLLDFHFGYNHKSLKGFKLKHSLSFKNVTNSDMLIPEYIRKRPGVNSLATTGFGRQLIYTLKIEL